MRSAGSRHQSKLDLGQPDLGIGRRYAIVARQRDLEAAAQSRAMNGGNNRLRTILDRFGDFRKMRRLRRLAELRDVRPGDKRCSLTADHNGPDACIGIGLADCGQQPRPHRLAERVDRRVVHFNKSDITLSYDRYNGTHDFNLSLGRIFKKMVDIAELERLSVCAHHFFQCQ